MIDFILAKTEVYMVGTLMSVGARHLHGTHDFWCCSAKSDRVTGSKVASRSSKLKLLDFGV